MNTCALCPQPAPEDTYACPGCLDEIRGWLAELPQQAQLLADEFLVPGASPAQGRIGGTGRAHSPVPVDLRVLVLLGAGHVVPTGAPEDDTDSTVPIPAFVIGWARYLATTYPAVHRDRHGTTRIQPCDQPWPTAPDLTGWCAWITAYLPWAAQHTWIADLHRQLDALLRRVRDLTHTTPHTHTYAAPCPDCDGFGLVRTDGHWHIRCTLCGHHLTPDAYDAHAADVYAAYSADPAPDKVTEA
ncbi:MAG TPA: hypothetical protein VIU15_38360 [Streptomyces sp.]